MANAPTPDGYERQLQRLQGWRCRRSKATDLKFMRDQFQRDVEKPYKQLGQFAELWEQLVPASLTARTALEKFSRGTLHVQAADSVTAYELDRALRTGLQRQLRARFKGNLRQIRVKVKGGGSGGLRA